MKYCSKIIIFKFLLFLLFFSRFSFSLIISAGDSQFNNEIFIAYTNTHECRQFIIDRFVSLTFNGERLPEGLFFNDETIRSLILPLMIGYETDFIPENVVPFDTETTHYSMYDKTIVQFVRRNSLFSDQDGVDVQTDSVVEFQWLKHILLDRVTLPPAIETQRYQEHLESIPCIKFATTTTFRTIPLPPDPISDYEENLIFENA